MFNSIDGNIANLTASTLEAKIAFTPAEASEREGAESIFDSIADETDTTNESVDLDSAADVIDEAEDVIDAIESLLDETTQDTEIDIKDALKEIGEESGKDIEGSMLMIPLQLRFHRRHLKV